MWANGKRIEYAGGSWDEGYRCSFTPKWFPKLEADEVSPLGYLYKISWYITHPYTKQQVDSMRDYEKEDNGLNEDGNITYRIELIGDGCSTPEVSNGYNMPYPDFYKLEPGGIASVTWSYYDLAKIDSICIRFDKWKYDGENNGWCEELAVESESSQTVGVFGNFDEGTTAVQSSSGGFTASGGEATGATSAPEAVEKDCPPSFPQC